MRFSKNRFIPRVCPRSPAPLLINFRKPTPVPLYSAVFVRREKEFLPHFLILHRAQELQAGNSDKNTTLFMRFGLHFPKRKNKRIQMPKKVRCALEG